jgi:hypothetical protein
MSLTKTNFSFSQSYNLSRTIYTFIAVETPFSFQLYLLPSVMPSCSQVTVTTIVQICQLKYHHQFCIKNILQIVLKITDLKMFIIFFGEVLHSYRCINTFVYMTQAIKRLPTQHLRRKIKIDVAQASAS